MVGMGLDFLDHQTCKGLAKDRSILVDIVDIRTEKNWSSAPGFMLLRNKNVLQRSL